MEKVMDTHATPAKHLRSTTPVMAAPNSHAKLAELAEALRPASASARLLGSNGVELALPEPVHQLLERIVEMLARGLAVTLVPVDKLLTTQQAADLLNVSRQYLVRLLEDGQLPFSKVGTHRRLKIEDVLKYKSRRDSDRRGKLAELTQLTEEAGGYDEK
jgi:excisionase family DNA binding protein